MKNKGLWFAFGAYFIWGLFPIYWKLLKNVSALELIGHRIIWSFVMLAGVITLTAQWRRLRTVAFNGRVLRIYSLAAVLIGANWLMYVWAVNAGFIVETSLGYFINPLLSVLLGVIIFREKLRLTQWIPVGLAALGVGYLTFVYGRLPWIALSLAFTFGFYGLVKKLAPLGSLYGLTLETGILFLPALGYLLFLEIDSSAAFLRTGLTADLLMIGAGLVTTVPLLMFASAAQRIPLSMIGIMQYFAPTLQFLIGVLVYHEPFSQAQFVGFAIVWVALIIFWVDGYAASRRARLASAPLS
ncbi:MAG: EamA family transporter RarD [Anaerolineales bacterium]